MLVNPRSGKPSRERVSRGRESVSVGGMSRSFPLAYINRITSDFVALRKTKSGTQNASIIYHSRDTHLSLPLTMVCKRIHHQSRTLLVSSIQEDFESRKGWEKKPGSGEEDSRKKVSKGWEEIYVDGIKKKVTKEKTGARPEI